MRTLLLEKRLGDGRTPFSLYIYRNNTYQEFARHMVVYSDEFTDYFDSTFTLKHPEKPNIHNHSTIVFSPNKNHELTIEYEDQIFARDETNEFFLSAVYATFHKQYNFEKFLDFLFSVYLLDLADVYGPIYSEERIEASDYRKEFNDYTKKPLESL